MKYSQVKNCRYSNAENTAIDCEVLFDTLGWIPFTASLNDLEHSNEIYLRAQNRDFGDIAPYQLITINTIEISQSEIVRTKRNSLLTNLDKTICNPLRWSNFSQEEQADFARYRQALLDLPQQPGFPTEVLWPAPPANLVEPQEVTLSIVS